jgi:hypothetical protein
MPSSDTMRATESGWGCRPCPHRTRACAFRHVALPFLEALHHGTGQAVHLAVLRGADMVRREVGGAGGSHTHR